jgi:hypothetical protein
MLASAKPAANIETISGVFPKRVQHLFHNGERIFRAGGSKNKHRKDRR